MYHQADDKLVDLSIDILLLGGTKFRANIGLDWANIECKPTTSVTEPQPDTSGGKSHRQDAP